METLAEVLDLHHHSLYASDKGHEVAQLVQDQQVVYDFEKLISHVQLLEVPTLFQPPVVNQPAH